MYQIMIVDLKRITLGNPLDRIRHLLFAFFCLIYIQL